MTDRIDRRAFLMRSLAAGGVVAAGVAGGELLASCSSPGGGSAGMPLPLSAEQAAPDIDSDYGSGIFGTWSVDAFGLPVYRYTMDEESDPRARQVELGGRTEAWSQVGNDHIMANAFNHGYVQMWSQDRIAQWLNRYDAASRHFSGGYGYVNVGGSTFSTLYVDRAAGATCERTFGVGYYSRRMRTAEVEVDDAVYAPFGNDPVLLHDVTITNLTKRPRELSWFEYWDVNPYDQEKGKQRGLAEAMWDRGSQTLSAAQLPYGGDERPFTIFCAQLDGSTDAFDTDGAAFFGMGSRAHPGAVAAGHLSGSLAPAVPNLQTGSTLLALQTKLRLGSGHSATLRYMYGCAHPWKIFSLVSKYRAAEDSFSASARSWLGALPKASFGSERPWLGRELMWDAYLLRSASFYAEVCGHHTITQGGYYQYDLGLDIGTRSWLGYVPAVTYLDPALARSVLLYSAQLQPPVTHQLPYGMADMCKTFDLGTSDDLDFWLLWASAHYGLATRDVAFFDTPVRFYGTPREVSLWDHLKLAFAHQQSLIGPHGELVSLSLGDWSDFSTKYMDMTESTLVVAQCAYAYPRLAALAELRGDHAFAGELRSAAAAFLATLRGQWMDKGWYSRGYSGEAQLGYGAIWLEPQPWAILCGAPTDAQVIELVANIRRFLDGVGAPAVVHGPNRIGTSIGPARDDPDVSETTTPHVGIGDNNAVWPGGTWFDPDGWLTWAYASLDGRFPRARELAFDQYVRTTLANHAEVFPENWDGITSVDDVCWSFYSSDPGRCGGVLGITSYEGQIAEQPCWMQLGALNLAGITPTGAGYDITPHFPFDTFDVRFPLVGLAGRPGLLRGYVRPVAGGSLRLQVALPAGVTDVVVWAAGRQVSATAHDGSVGFPIATSDGEPADWAVAWKTG
ncbi:MAG: hypothetical protein M0035_03500 [Actinomycetota bacterium]|nr:hypothetical protein [Actinomycetota bacterium]